MLALAFKALEVNRFGKGFLVEVENVKPRRSTSLLSVAGRCAIKLRSAG